ncbi:MAG: PKD domain-containing protein [Candidatus Diapherotrites archaeon]
MALESLKKFYYGIEDKYYSLLDKINRFVPVYKLVDPIDKALPSFMVFIGLFCLLLVFGLFWFFPLLPPEGPFTARILVLGDDTNAGISGAEVKIALEGEKGGVSGKTDANGFLDVNISSKSVKASIEVSAEGYDKYSNASVLISSEKPYSLKVKRSEALFKPKIKMQVFDFDSKLQILDRPITLTFYCTGSSSANIPPINSLQNELVPFEVEIPLNCGTFVGTASASGYKDSPAQQLATDYESNTVPFFLKKSDSGSEGKGALSVMVLDNAGNPAKNIPVKLSRSASGIHVKTDFTKDSGSVLFDSLEPGQYTVFCDAGDGRTAEQKEIIVVSGSQPAEVSLNLPVLASLTKKLYFLVVDAEEGTPIAGARAVIYMGTTWFISVDTNAAGTASVPVGLQDASKVFTANVSAAGHIIKSVVLPVLDFGSTAPTNIGLAPEKPGQNFKPVAVFTADKYAGSAPLTVEFDASGSSDPDGIIASYDWNFGDGGKAGTVKATHTFSENGTYIVSLIVRDDRNAAGKGSMAIQVKPEGQNFSPIALFSMKPYYGYAPLTIDFNAEASFDYDGTIQSYAWHFGDGSAGSGKNISHTFNSSGDYDIALTITDDDSASGTLVVSLQVLDQAVKANLKPVAGFAVENNYYYGAVPHKVSFDASQSYDPDGSVVFYRWDFGDNESDEGLQKQAVSHTFTSAGNFTAKLTVKDNNNAVSTHSASIQVVPGPANWKPVAIMDANVYHGKTQFEVEFSASKSFDPDGSVVFYNWNFGDGSPAEEGINKKTAKHLFSSAGDFVVSVTVKDDDGAASTDSALIQSYSSAPENLTPVAIFTPSAFFGAKPLLAAFDASPSFDPDGALASYAWDFGDGGTASGKIVSHSFSGAGEFNVTLTVKDGKGAAGTRSRKIQVIEPGVNLNPIAKISASSLFGQKPLSADFSAEDSFDPDGTIKSYEWNFGDGSSVVTGQKVSHKFETEGVFEVKLAVKDNSNKSGNVSVFVQVVGWSVQTYGNILVKAANPVSQPVQNASLFLYREDVGVPLGDPEKPIFSGADGSFLFEKMPASISKYFSRAFYDPNLSGESVKKNVVPAGKIDLDLKLSSMKGIISAKALKDSQPVQDAVVSFVKAADSVVLGTCTTAADGNCLSPLIDAGTRVKVSAQKAGSLTAESDEIEIIADNTHSVTVELMDVPPTGVAASFVMFCEDALCASPAPAILSDPSAEKVYYAKFNLLLGAAKSTAVKFSSIAGSLAQTALPAQGYKVKIAGLADSSTDAKIFATCVDPLKWFETVPSCTGSGDSFKHSIAAWNELKGTAGVSKTVIVKIAIEKGLAAGTVAELRFAAKATQDGKDVNTDLLVVPIVVGAPVCSGNEKIVFSRYIVIDGKKIDLPVDPPASKFAQLVKGADYNIFFSVKNCTGQAISGLKIKVWNEKDPDCISFPELGGGSGPYDVMTIASLASGAVSEEKRVAIRAFTTTDRTMVDLNAEFGSERITSSMFFKVLADKIMAVENLPIFLLNGAPVKVSGIVRDSGDGTSVIQGAIVQVLLNSTVLGSVQSDASGNFSFTQASGANPVLSDIVKVRVNKAGYNEYVAQIPVKAGGGLSLIDCVKIEPKVPAIVAKGAQGTFNVISTNCPKKATLTFSSALEMPLKSIVLNETEARSVSFKASGSEVFQGIYPISVSGSLEGSASQRHIGIFEAIVNDPASCFAMDKPTDNYIFDLLGGPVAATIKNKCFFENRSAEYPFIGINNAGVELSKTAAKDLLPESVSFSWKINAFAKQDGGSDFNVKAVEKTFTAKPRESIVFELDSFNAADYVNGNSAKGITGLKQSPAYKGGLLFDVWFAPSTSNGDIEAWIEGDKIMGRYNGQSETTGFYPISIANKFLAQTEYSMVSIDDLVKGGSG